MAEKIEKPDDDAPPAMTPAAAALEMARLRLRVKELEEKEVPSYSPTIGSSMESYAGQADDGEATWFYKIDLPPSGGVDVSINGTKFYQDQTYTFRTATLAVVKDAVARAWKHEDSIRGSNENFYRRPTERTLRGNGR